MDLKLKERVVIEFLAKEGCPPKEIHMRLKKVYGDAVMDISNVRRWVKKFSNGETEIADKPRSGRPTTSITDANRERAEELIRGDRRITVQSVADALNISYGSAQGIIADLGYHKVCAKWVPKQLTVDNRMRRVDICQELLDAFAVENQDFFNNMVTGDETWAYLYDPESKVQSKEWRHSDSPRPKKFKSSRSTKKIMATVFWDTQGVILVDFLQDRATIDSETYVNTLRKLKEALRKKRPLKDIHSIKLHHDNARPHTSFFTTQAIAKMGWSVVPHPPYSPDLAPSDFYLFGPLKEHLRGCRFNDLDEVKTAVKSWVKKQPPEFFQNGFDAWVQRWRKCVQIHGDYVEG